MPLDYEQRRCCNGLIVRAVRLYIASNKDFRPIILCDPDSPTSQTHGQTDRRMTCNINIALCTSASRGKNDT